MNPVRCSSRRGAARPSSFDVIAKTHQGLDSLLGHDGSSPTGALRRKATPRHRAPVIESSSIRRGAFVSVLIQRGTLRVGRRARRGVTGAVRASTTSSGNKVTARTPARRSRCGLRRRPEAGAIVRVVENERAAHASRGGGDQPVRPRRRSKLGRSPSRTFFKLAAGTVRSSARRQGRVAGSMEALEDEIAKLPQQEDRSQHHPPRRRRDQSSPT